MKAASGLAKLNQKLGYEISKLAEEQIGLTDNRRLSDWLDAVGRRLTAGLDDQPYTYSFKIIDSEIPNAFALPGGYTYVTRGLLASINQEEEIAGVLGHEIIHVHKNHGIKRLKWEILPLLLKLPGIIVGLVHEDLGNKLKAPIETVNSVFRAAYSREHEKEADQLGLELVTKAGYHPQGFVSCLANLQKEMEFLTGEKEKAGLLDDHPVTSERLAYLNQQIPTLRLNLLPPEVDSVYELLDGLLFGPNPRQGGLRQNTFIHPGLQVCIEFPKGWTITREPDAVKAVEENMLAGIVLSLEKTNHSCPELAASFKNKVPAAQRKTLIKDTPISLNGFPGHLLSFRDDTALGTTYIHLAWLNFFGRVCKVAGMGYEYFQPILTESANSIKPLSEAEYRSLKMQLIQVRQAQGGETVEQFFERTPSVISLQQWLVLNGLAPKTVLRQGQKLKTVVEQPFVIEGNLT